MQQYPDKKTLQEVLQFAESPDGQKLIAMIQKAGGSSVDAARAQAAGGNYEQAKKTLSQILQTEDIKNFIQEMRSRHD